jgi:hypothetical protein
MGLVKPTILIYVGVFSTGYWLVIVIEMAALKVGNVVAHDP